MLYLYESLFGAADWRLARLQPPAAAGDAASPGCWIAYLWYQTATGLAPHDLGAHHRSLGRIDDHSWASNVRETVLHASMPNE
jgi:hypothetical protein